MGSSFSAEQHIVSEQQRFAKDLRYLLTETAGEELVKTIDNVCSRVPESTTTGAKISACPATQTPARNLLFTQDMDLLSFPMPIILPPLPLLEAVSGTTQNLLPAAILLSVPLSVPRDKKQALPAHKPLAQFPMGGLPAQGKNPAVLPRSEAPAPTVPFESKPEPSHSMVLIPPLKQARRIAEELNGDSGSSLPCGLPSHPAWSSSQAGVFVVQEIKGPPGRHPSSAQLSINDGQRLQVQKAPDPVDSLGQTDNVDSVPTHDSAFRAACSERAWKQAVANAADNRPANVTFDMLEKERRFATCEQEAAVMIQAVTQLNTVIKAWQNISEPGDNTLPSVANIQQAATKYNTDCVNKMDSPKAQKLLLVPKQLAFENADRMLRVCQKVGSQAHLHAASVKAKLTTQNPTVGVG